MGASADPSSSSNQARLGTALVVEDNIMIALGLEAMLQDCGTENCYLAGTVETALLVLESKKIDFALVDVNLGEETSEEVALALQARKLPFLFITGYDEKMPMTQHFPDIPVLTKPLHETLLCETLAQIGVN